ncbi:hypothetical protein [Halobaculum lipolyticum]|uniref:Uncharacterized protein n=1 Tax=Halobaculum lipolyticum TaxID=3032001 RepID=A0ABD5WCT0_9EURY|nr:hypothetical protein [Halobaculum sp. DT31]
MIDCDAVASEATAEDADPRLDPERVRCLPGDGDRGSVLVVGVVHDHPASVYRAVHLVTGADPDVLALELPPLSVPLFRRYARDRHTPPRLGGEMSAAVRAAGAVPVVGIDAPNARYLRTLAARLRGAGSRDLAVAVARDTARGVAQAVACRLGAVVARLTPYTPRLYTQIPYESTLLDAPGAQATHEERHLARHRAFVGVVKAPPATALIDRAREDVMAARLHELRVRGDVVAVVGATHLDPLADRLAALAGDG